MAYEKYFRNRRHGLEACTIMSGDLEDAISYNEPEAVYSLLSNSWQFKFTVAEKSFILAEPEQTFLRRSCSREAQLSCITTLAA